MSKFVSKSKGTRTINRAGGKAYKQTDKLSFVSILLTSFLSDQHYRSGDQTMDGLVNLYQGLPDKLFAAKASLYARKEFGMRSVSHVIAGEIAGTVKGEQWTKRYFEKVINRPDDMMEILGYYQSKYGKNEPNALKKGFARVLSGLDEYKLAKYKYDGKDVSLIDVVNLVHPKHTEAISKLIKGELAPADTWETKMTATRGDSDKKNQVWKELILERKIGYFALLRNLRNILEQAPDVVSSACELLTDEKMIKGSLVLPFRFVTAINEIEKVSGSREVLVALNKALDISCQNVPKFDGKTLIVLDVSGSMSGRPAEIGGLFSAILYKANDADFMTFDNDARYQTLNPLDSTLSIAKSIDYSGGGTNFHSIFQAINRAYDRIVILSDMQGWIGYTTPTKAFNAYKTRYNCDPFVYSFDLQGYGDMQFPQNKVACIAGWSEKIFDVMKVAEQDKNALINKIDQIEI